MTVTVYNLADVVILRCNGRLVRGEESALLCAAVRHYGREVVLDLTEVSTIDAAGIGALVSLQGAGIYLKLINPTEPVRTVLRLTGMDSLFEIGDGHSPAEPRLQLTPEPIPLLAQCCAAKEILKARVSTRV